MTAVNTLKIIGEQRIAVTDLRRKVYYVVLGTIFISAWSAFLLLDLTAIIFSSTMFLVWLCALLVCSVSYWLHRHRPALAVALLLGGLWLCTISAFLIFRSPVFLYLLAAFSLVATVLAGRMIALTITSASTLFLMVMLNDKLRSSDIFAPIVLIWFTLILSYVVFTSVYETLDKSWSYQTYITQQMQEARKHRAELTILSKSLHETKHNLEDANAQLRLLRSAADEARNLKAMFAANVSHELRTPINLIVGFSEMLMTLPQADEVRLPSVYAMAMYTISRNAKHLQTLINDILDVSQIDAGRMSVVKEETDLHQVVTEAVDLVRESILNKGLTIEVIITNELPHMTLDRIRIKQVLLNILGNAIRFTTIGGITVSVSTNDEQVQISIADTGVGIDPTELDNVFKQFHQIDNSFSKQYSGSGLGLTLSKQFVELHGGRLWVESEGVSGKGSTFHFVLPVTGKVLPMVTGNRYAGADSDSMKRFIILDDDPAILQLFQRYVTRHHVTVASTIEELAYHLENSFPSAIVMDADTPYAEDASPFQFNGQSPSIIRCTMPSGKRQMQKKGVTDYLVKPVSRETLTNALQRLSSPIQTIMIIDDDKDMVRLLTFMLSSISASYKVRKAYNGQEGLAFMLSAPPDMVILDMVMPEMDGIALIQQMRNHATLADIPILMVSSGGGVDAIETTAPGTISVSKTDGFQPLEIVHCVEALVSIIQP